MWIVLIAAGALTSAAPAVRGAAVTARTAYVSAVDAKGEFVTDLTAADLLVTEGGNPREVTALAPAAELCHVAVLVDDGGGGLMQMPVAELLNAAAGRAVFSISLLNPQAIRLNDYTDDRETLQKSIGRLVQRGFLARDSLMLIDGVAWVARDMQKRKLSRPVIVTLTNGGESGERDIAKDILNDLAASGASLHVVHVIGLPLGEVLVDGPQRSGGTSAAAGNTEGFARAVTAIARVLAHQYKLTYALPTGVKPGERLKVTSTRPGVKILAPTRISNKVQ